MLNSYYVSAKDIMKICTIPHFVPKTKLYIFCKIGK